MKNLPFGSWNSLESHSLTVFNSRLKTVLFDLSTIQPLQRVMNAAARVIMALSTRDHVKPTLKQLHWLPVEQRISYKLCHLMHYIHTGQAPQYLSNCVSTISSSGNRYRLTMSCREHAPGLANVVSSTLVLLPAY